MIDINNLTIEDVGKSVIYDNGFKKETGKIKSWNENWIFVVYRCNNYWYNYSDYTGCATNPRDLEFIDNPAVKK